MICHHARCPCFCRLQHDVAAAEDGRATTSTDETKENILTDAVVTNDVTNGTNAEANGTTGSNQGNNNIGSVSSGLNDGDDELTSEFSSCNYKTL